MFDVWEVNDIYCVRLFASFMTKFKVVYKGSVKIELKHELQLISVAPIPGMKRTCFDEEMLKMRNLFKSMHTS